MKGKYAAVINFLFFKMVISGKKIRSATKAQISK